MIPTDSHGPLNGIRVLDASRVLAGPFCGQMLADLGADVVKLERPGQGDETRGWGPPFDGDFTAYFLSCNRGKRAITLDIASPEGRVILDQLLDRCDILLENFRTDSVVKLNLTPDELLFQHPKLIVCSISGFGRTGPLRDVPGYDFAIQALSGLMSITGPIAGPPSKVGVAIADVLTGVYAAVAILACVNARRNSGHGYAIDLSLLDCALAAQVNVAQAYLSTGSVPARQGNAHLQIVPYQLFATSDGWIVLACGNDSQWRNFCLAAEEPQLAADPDYQTNSQRVRGRETLVPKVAEVIARRSSAEWLRRLTLAGVPHSEVRTYDQLFAEPQIAERGMKVTVTDPLGRPVNLVGSPFHIAGSTPPAPKMPPSLGQDTDRVMGDWLGLDAAKLAELRRSGVV